MVKRSKPVGEVKKPFRFDESLALFQYMLSLFGKESLDSLCEGMKGENWEGWDEQNISRCYHFLTTQLFEFPGVTKEQLLRYDQNITRYTLAIGGRRGVFRWKYFQYMAFLRTPFWFPPWRVPGAGQARRMLSVIQNFKNVMSWS